jgi:hypothetical protein
MDFSKWRREILHEIEHLVFYNYFVFFGGGNKFELKTKNIEFYNFEIL